MTNGLGASFGGLMLIASLAGLASILTLTMVAVSILQGHTSTIPRGYYYLAALLSGGVLLIAGFAVVALSDEAAALAIVFVALVFVPFGICGVYLYRRTAFSPLDLLATTGIAWGLPFLLGITTTFGGLSLVTSVFKIASDESQRLGFHWIATAIGAVVVVLGTLLSGTHLSDTLATPTNSTS